MAELLEIAQLGNPILRQPACPVPKATTPAIQALIDSLVETATAAHGVGLAAPQVSQSYRLFIIASRPSPRYPQAPVMAPTAMINPKILAHSPEKSQDWEGCLSIPGLRGLVPRYQEITVEYTDRSGQLQQQELIDFAARIFQHELDHLNGIVFLDRLETTRDLVTEQEYQRLLPIPARLNSEVCPLLRIFSH